MKFWTLFLCVLAALTAGAAAAATQWTSPFVSVPIVSIPFKDASGTSPVVFGALPGKNLYISCYNLSFSTNGTDALLRVGRVGNLVTTNYSWLMTYAYQGLTTSRLASSADATGEDTFVRLFPKGDVAAGSATGDQHSFELTMSGARAPGYPYFQISSSYQSMAAYGGQGMSTTTFHNWQSNQPIVSVAIYPEAGTFSGTCRGESFD